MGRALLTFVIVAGALVLMTLAEGLKSVVPSPIGSLAKIAVVGVSAYLLFALWRPERDSAEQTAPAQRKWNEQFVRAEQEWWELMRELDALARQDHPPSDRVQTLRRQLYEVENVLGDQQISRLQAQREAGSQNSS